MTPDDMYVLYSDGLVEARNHHGQEYGEERLCQIVEQTTHLPANLIKEAILSDVQSFVGQAKTHDDLTCVVLKVSSIYVALQKPDTEYVEHAISSEPLMAIDLAKPVI